MFDGENSYQYPHLGHLPLLYHASIRQGTLKSTENYPPPTLNRAAKRGKLEGKNDIKALADLSVSKVLSSKSSFSIITQITLYFPCIWWKEIKLSYQDNVPTQALFTHIMITKDIGSMFCKFIYFGSCRYM